MPSLPTKCVLFNHARDYYRDYLRGFRRGIGKWFTTKILENIRGIGTSTITILMVQVLVIVVLKQMQNLTINDATALNQQSYVQSVTPNSSSSGTLIYGNQTFSSTSLKGVGEQYFDVDGLKLKSGNLFSAQDVADNNQVALIDESEKVNFPG